MKEKTEYRWRLMSIQLILILLRFLPTLKGRVSFLWERKKCTTVQHTTSDLFLPMIVNHSFCQISILNTCGYCISSTSFLLLLTQHTLLDTMFLCRISMQKNTTCKSASVINRSQDKKPQNNQTPKTNKTQKKTI